LKKWGLCVTFLWLVVLIFIAPRIDAYNQTSASVLPAHDMPFLLKLLGEGKAILSNLSLLQADLYFHGGVGHFHEEHKEGLAIGEREEGHEPGEHEHLHMHEEEHRKAKIYNILLRVSEEIGVTEHIHLQKEDEKEIIPWLYYSAKIDPHNVLAYTLTSYWLADRFDKVDEAFSFLRKGLLNNPESWEINLELGRLYFMHRKNYEAATRYLTRAWFFMQRVPHDKFEERQVLSLLALSFEALDQPEKALSIYQRLDKLFPGAFEKKIEELS
jgi:tetratricopeptide (TPR) repeat protein